MVPDGRAGVEVGAGGSCCGELLLHVALRPVGAELFDGCALAADGGRGQVKEVGNLHQLHVGVLARVNLMDKVC